MSQRFLVFLFVTAVAVAACHSSSSPTPTGTPYSPTPDPKITKATVEVTINQKPRAHIPVAMSTPANKESPRPGKTIVTVYTGKKGFARFNHLKASATYCWVATLYTNSKSFECAGWAVWQTSDILLGT